jgi:dTMP kinase
MDRYWLSTLAYARARGVVIDLSDVEAVVPAPDLTILLTLDEDERMRRIRDRGGATYEDLETAAPAFRDEVLREMRRRDRRSDLVPIEVDLTGADCDEAVRRVVSALTVCGRR